MKRWRGDGLAAAAIIFGAALAWTGTSVFLSWAASRAAGAALETMVLAAGVATVAAATVEGLDGLDGVGEAESVEPATTAEVDPVLFPPAPTREGVAFRASSLNSGFSVQGDYGGRLTLEGESVRLHMPEALIRHSAVYGTGGARLAGIRLSLAEDTSTGWHIVQKGKFHPVRQDLHSGEELWLADLVLELEGISESEAMDRWLVIEHELVNTDGSGPRTSWTYAHASQETLALLFGWEEDGC